VDSVRDGVVDAYLDRIGAVRPDRADAAALRELQLCHLRTVPFENLSIHLGEEIRLVEDFLVEKVVTRQRGGFCYELNGAFAALLTALGYRVTLLAARVADGDRFGPPFAHLGLRVDLDEPWLVDVGFGRFTHHPLRLDSREPQPDPAGTFEIVDGPDGDLDVLREGQPEYRLERRPRALAHFAPTCWYQRTSPESPFTRSLVCTRLTGSGRITLSGATLIDTAGGHRDERIIDSADEVLAVYRDVFGIVLDRLPEDPAHGRPVG